MSALSQCLVEYAEELDEAAAGSGLTYLKTLRDKALAFIEDGKSTEIIRSSFDGQSAEGVVQVSADRMFEEVSAAIREHQGKDIKITYANFSDAIPH